tara:strand:- start:14759 stop:15277 length:519 start_codon:yes stop_codon:yes gene_type:complete
MTDAEGARVTIGGLMKRIELLECQRRDDDAANRGLVRRIDTLQSEVEERKRLWVEAMDEAQACKDRAEAAEARVAELESWYAAPPESQRELLKRIAELEQEAVPVSDPHPDTARLDWLDQRGGALAWFSGTWAWMDDPDENTGRTLREAIDAAMKGDDRPPGDSPDERRRTR